MTGRRRVGAVRERIEAKIELRDNGHETPCWWWTGIKDPNGYGVLYSGETKKTGRAHRLSYESYVGPIPEGLVLDHLCRVPSCVNPEHLEPVTTKENIRRGATYLCGWNQRLKTHCPKGHAYDERNTYINPRDGGRVCRKCHAWKSSRAKGSPRWLREQAAKQAEASA